MSRVASPLAPAFDLLAAYEPGGVLFDRGGLGVSTGATGEDVEVADVTRRLKDTPHRSVAAGALAFSGGGALRISDRIVRRTAPGVTWLVGEAGAFDRVSRTAAPAAAFGPLQRRAVPDETAYGRAVEGVVARIGAGELRKVVLARTLEVNARRTLDPARLAHRLRAVNPGAFTFAAPAPGGTIVGASPELLVSRRGSVVRANPLAGTAPRAGDPDEDHTNAERLLASAKDRVEHAIVVEAIAEVLAPRCERLAFDPEPLLLETPNVWHLSTRFEGELRDPAPTALDLARDLHPTPAVAGMPRDDALTAIGELEPFARGAYAGPVGWVDASGDGEFAIALRCAVLDGEHATLYAGAGIVAGSVAASELDETERKFRAFLDALRWG